MTNEFTRDDIGKKVYCLRHGWGTIDDFIGGITYPVRVCFGTDDSDRRQSYTTKGIFTEGEKNQSLFWDEVKIIPPPRPKQKTKKEITLFRYTYKNMLDLNVIQTAWMTESPNNLPSFKLLKTGTKKIEVEE